MGVRRLIPAVFSAAVCIASAAQSAVTYREIAPILARSCSPCHRPGQAGPFPLLTYDDARRRAAQIAAVTRRRYMPPWLPEPGRGDFVGERRLTDAQIRSIEEWARAGPPEAPRQPAASSPKVAPEWVSGPPDLVIRAAKPFALPADG